MNRGIFSERLEFFYDRLACAQLADSEAMKQVNESLRSYLSSLEESYEAVDKFTLDDLSKVYAYHHFNRPHIKSADEIDDIFIETKTIISAHRNFLESNHLLPDYLGNWTISEGV